MLAIVLATTWQVFAVSSAVALHSGLLWPALMPRQLRSSDGQLFELSDLAARQSLYLHGDEDIGDGVVAVPLESGRLHKITALLERTAAMLEGTGAERDALLKEGLPLGATVEISSEAEDEVAVTATMLQDLKWFDAPLPATVLAQHVAQLLSGESAESLRWLLGAPDDLDVQMKEAALAEPLFALPSATVPDAAAEIMIQVPDDVFSEDDERDGDSQGEQLPVSQGQVEYLKLLQVPVCSRYSRSLEQTGEEPPPLARSISLVLDGGDPEEGNIKACLNLCDAQTLRQLKAVSLKWQRPAQGTLFDRLCSRQNKADGWGSLEDVEEVDVEELWRAGRPQDAIAAGQQLPNLARLRGYGFTVNVQAVQQAALGVADALDGAALRSCISPNAGEPPRELLLAAIACAGSGDVLGIPVQQLRRGELGAELVLIFRRGKRGIDSGGARLLALFLSLGNTILTSLNLYGARSGAPPPPSTSVRPRARVVEALRCAAREFAARARCAYGAFDPRAAGNSIGDEGAKELAAALKENKNLTTLNLGSACSGAPPTPHGTALRPRAPTHAGGVALRRPRAYAARVRCAHTARATRMPQRMRSATRGPKSWPPRSRRTRLLPR